MAVSIFGDKAKKPTDQMLFKALGKSNRLWKGIKSNLRAEYAKAAAQSMGIFAKGYSLRPGVGV